MQRFVLMASARSRYHKHHTTISISICSEPSWISTQITRDKMYDKRLCNQVLPLFKNLHEKKNIGFFTESYNYSQFTTSFSKYDYLITIASLFLHTNSNPKTFSFLWLAFANFIHITLKLHFHEYYLVHHGKAINA